MRRFTLIIILVLIAIVIVVLSVANRHLVTVSADPVGGDAAALSITAPLFVVVFAALGIGILIGGVAAWVRQGRWRKLARSDRAELVRLRQQAERPPDRSPSGPPSQGLPAPRNAA